MNNRNTKKIIAIVLIAIVLAVIGICVYFLSPRYYEFQLNDTNHKIIFTLDQSYSVVQSDDTKTFIIEAGEGTLVLEIHSVENWDTFESSLSTLYGIVASQGLDLEKLDSKTYEGKLLEHEVYVSDVVDEGKTLLFRDDGRLYSLIKDKSGFILRGFIEEGMSPIGGISVSIQ